MTTSTINLMSETNLSFEELAGLSLQILRRQRAGAESARLHPETWMRLLRDCQLIDTFTRQQPPKQGAGLPVEIRDDVPPGVIRFVDSKGREIGLASG